jgi:uncharacterized protein involved in cysteine biosynthesis
MVPIIYLRWLGRPDMSHLFFTNLPSSTSVNGLPALSHDVDGAASAKVGRGRLAVLLVLAAATFLLIAVAAYLAALLYHRLLRSSVEQKRPVGVRIGVQFWGIEGRGPC